MQGIPGMSAMTGMPGMPAGMSMGNFGQMGIPQYMMAQPNAAQMMQIRNQMGQNQSFNMTDKRKK